MKMRLLALHGQDPHPDRAGLSGIADYLRRKGLSIRRPVKKSEPYQAIYGEQAHPAIADNLDHLGDLALQQQAYEAMTYQRAYEMKMALPAKKRPIWP